MFEQRLKDLRNGKKMTQDDLGSFLNVSGKTIGAWERGSRQPNLDMINKIANFFSVSTDYLLGQTDIKKSQKEASKENPIDKMLDDAMSNDGKPMTENDREIIKGMIEAYLKNKK